MGKKHPSRFNDDGRNLNQQKHFFNRSQQIQGNVGNQEPIKLPIKEDKPKINTIEKRPIVWVASFYTDSNKERNDELRKCLRINIENPLISFIHLFVEDCTISDAVKLEPLLLNPKVFLIEFGKRITFRDVFDYSNMVLIGNLVVLSNADIYFDETLNLARKYDFNNLMLCLTRTETQSKKIETSGFSQDTWIFVPPIKKFDCNWYLGKLGCDSRLSYEADKAGMKLLNPSLSIKTWHLHDSRIRHYSSADAIPGIFKSIDISE